MNLFGLLPAVITQLLCLFFFRSLFGKFEPKGDSNKANSPLQNSQRAFLELSSYSRHAHVLYSLLL